MKSASLLLGAFLVSCSARPLPPPGAVPSSASPPSPQGAPPSAPGRPLSFQDGFESGAIDSAAWTPGKPGARVEEGRAFRGRYALHVTAPAEGKVSVSLTHRLPPALETLFVRAFVWAPAPLPPHNWNYLWLAGEGHSWRLGGTTDPFGDAQGRRIVRVMHQPLHKQLLSEVAFATGRWVCWEIEVRSAERALNVWVDGQLVPSMSLPGDGSKAGVPWVFPKFDRLDIGLQHAHPTPAPVDVWIDEVAVDGRRIGCDR